MLLAQGRLWRATLARDDRVALGVLRDHLPADLHELRDLRIEVPLERWNEKSAQNLVAGIHTARWGGTSQLPSWVRTSMAPCAAKMSWARSCRCGAM